MRGEGRVRPRIALLLLCLAAAAPAAAGPLAPDEEEPFTPAEYAAAVSSTIAGCTVSALLGPTPTPLPLAVSNFLLDHPDMSAYIADREGIAPYRIRMLGPRRSYADDGEGTKGVVNLLQATAGHRLYYGEGVHHSSLFPDIRAKAVIVMYLEGAIGPDARPQTIATFHVWVRIQNRFVSGVVKTLRPFLQGTVIRKFTKAFFVADSLGRLMARDPAVAARDFREFPGLFTEDRALILEMLARLHSDVPAASKCPAK